MGTHGFLVRRADGALYPALIRDAEYAEKIRAALETRTGVAHEVLFVAYDAPHAVAFG